MSPSDDWEQLELFDDEDWIDSLASELFLEHDAQRDKKNAPSDMIVDGAGVKKIQPALKQKRKKT